MSGDVAFSPDELREATKEFRGVIIDAEYGLEPFGMKGRADIQAKKQMCIKIETNAYDKPQYEWFAPSKLKKTKWGYLLEALGKAGALKDIVIEGKTADERVMSLARSLKGMEFDFIEYTDLPIVVKGKTTDCILPEVYHGRITVEPVTEIREGAVTL